MNKTISLLMYIVYMAVIVAVSTAMVVFSAVIALILFLDSDERREFLQYWVSLF